MTPVLPLPLDPSGLRESFHPASAESSRIRGQPAMPARHLSLHPVRLRRSPCGGDLRAARCSRPRCRGDVRSRELRPNPIRSNTSRHGTVAISAGNPIPCAAGSTEAGPSTRTIPPHAPFALASSELVGPRAPRLRRPPAASHPLSRTGPANRTARCDAPLARTTQHRPTRFGERAACAASPPGPRAASPAAPRRAPRSAAPEVPSIDELRPLRTPNLRPASSRRQGVIHRLSPTCG